MMRIGKKKIGVIGLGNMGGAIVTSLLTHRVAAPSHVWVYDVDSEKQKALVKKDKVNAAADAKILLSKIDILILAVKPQHMTALLESIGHDITHQLVISIAAGYSLARMRTFLKKKTKLIRLMPNTPCAVGHGVIGLVAGKTVTKADIALVNSLFSSMGVLIILNNEDELNNITAIASSGPAYFYYFLEALQEAAKGLGFSDAVAAELVHKTFIGSSMLLSEKKVHASLLRHQITSKGGTTEAALGSFGKDRLFEVVKRAVQSAKKRAQELA